MTDLSIPAALADLFVRSGMLLLLAWAAAAAIGKAGAPAASRHLVWLLCLAALLLLPLLAALLPAVALPILPSEAEAAAPVAAGPVQIAPATAEPSRTPFPLVWAIYALVATAIVARLLLGRWLLGSHWRRADSNAAFVGILEQLKARFGIGRQVELRLSRDPAMPITWGMANPRILLPADAASWPEERRRLVLLHELAHVARYDSPVRLAAALACALYWFQPAIWLAVRKLRIEQEHAADDLVLEAGAGARSYAFSLLEVAGGRSPPMMGQLYAAMAGPSELERRLKAIVAPRARGGPGGLFAAITIAAASASALLAATAMPVAASAGDAAAMSLAEPARAETPVAAPDPVALPIIGRTVARPVKPAARTAGVEAPDQSIALAAAPAVEAIAPVPAVPAIRARPAVEREPSEEDRARALEEYRRARAVYRQQLREYRGQLSEYHGQVSEQHRQVAALRREGNLANSGNDGNAGNAGNAGNEGGPGHMPVFPTAPTAPTPPTPPMAMYRRAAAVASVDPAPSAQGP
jgi:beta-lactamase regulating signal transducer with metallopeptidase domain